MARRSPSPISKCAAQPNGAVDGADLGQLLSSTMDSTWSDSKR